MSNVHFFGIRPVENDDKIVATGRMVWLGGVVELGYKLKRQMVVEHEAGVVVNPAGCYDRPWMRRNQEMVFPRRLWFGYGADAYNREDDADIRALLGDIHLLRDGNDGHRKRRNISPVMLNEIGELVPNPDFNAVLPNYRPLVQWIDLTWDGRGYRQSDMKRIKENLEGRKNRICSVWVGFPDGDPGDMATLTLWMELTVRLNGQGQIYGSFPGYNSASIEVRRLLDSTPEWAELIDLEHDKLAEDVTVEKLPDDLKRYFKENGQLVFWSRENATIYANNPIGNPDESHRKKDGTLAGRPIPCNNQFKIRILEKDVLPMFEKLGFKGLQLSDSLATEEAETEKKTTRRAAARQKALAEEN